MKNLFLLILIISISFAARSQQYGWTDISSNIPQNNEFPPDLSDLYFISDTVGWITTTSYSEIFNTNDGAATFSTQTTPLGGTSAIHMLDSINGYCGGQDGWIYNTSDGGLNWNMLGSVGTCLAMSFPLDADPNNPIGYASGNSGNVWKIASTLINLYSPSSSTFSGISAPSTNNVWACGGNRIYYYNGTDFTSQGGPNGAFNDIHFINNQEGWVVGDAGVIGKTSNGGTEWVTLENPDSQNRSLYGVFFLNSDHGWAVGADGKILHTIDGGTNWLIEGEGLTTSFLRGIHFTSPNNGYIVGNDKTLLKYTKIFGIAEEASPIDFEVFPNPCRDKLSIRNMKSELRNLKFELIDIRGRVVYVVGEMGRMGEEEISMDVSHLPAGLYLVKLQTEDAIGVRKLIKK